MDDALEVLARLVATLHTSVWNMQRHSNIVWADAEPAVPAGEAPPFTRRMVAIGIRVADGATDRQIARELGVSERTVSAEVREMSRRLGARNRTHAIALISGVSA